MALHLGRLVGWIFVDNHVWRPSIYYVKIILDFFWPTHLPSHHYVSITTVVSTESQLNWPFSGATHPSRYFADIIYGWSLGFFIFLHNAVRFGRFMGKNISKSYFHVWFWQDFYPKVKPGINSSKRFFIIKWTVLLNKSAILTKFTRSKNYVH